ncbi:MAG: hypothetical protein LBJ63_02875 [Prevotellaceae bacterium]|nr:hypothetical protein [Prevotellaceae bacterium]
MANNDTHKIKTVIEVADYLFANPLAKRCQVLAKFGKKWQIGQRTVDRLIGKAKKYNNNRQNLQEKAKNEVLIKSAKEAAIEAENRRKTNIETLEKIRDGKFAIKYDDKNIMVPTVSDILKAIGEINRIDGNYAPEKFTETDSRGNDVISTVNVNIRKQ